MSNETVTKTSSDTSSDNNKSADDGAKWNNGEQSSTSNVNVANETSSSGNANANSSNTNASSSTTTTTTNSSNSGGGGGGGGNDSKGENFIIRIRGIPWSSSREDILKFLKGANVKNGIEGIHFILTSSGRPSGEAYLEMQSEEDANKAADMHMEYMGSRYIEIFHSNITDMRIVMNKQHKAHSGGRHDGPFGGPPPPRGAGGPPGWGGRGGRGGGRSGGPPPPFGGGPPDMWRGGGGGDHPPDEMFIRLRGLPFQCQVRDVAKFFQGLDIAPNGIRLTYDRSNRCAGEAFVQFTTIMDADKAMAKHKEKIGHRYIELFRSSFQEFHEYPEVVGRNPNPAWMNDGRRGGPPGPPPPFMDNYGPPPPYGGPPPPGDYYGGPPGPPPPDHHDRWGGPPGAGPPGPPPPLPESRYSGPPPPSQQTGPGSYYGGGAASNNDYNSDGPIWTRESARFDGPPPPGPVRTPRFQKSGGTSRVHPYSGAGGPPSSDNRRGGDYGGPGAYGNVPSPTPRHSGPPGGYGNAGDRRSPPQQAPTGAPVGFDDRQQGVRPFPRDDYSRNPSNVIYMRRVPPHADEGHIRKFFSDCNVMPMSVQICRNEHGKLTGDAKIEFATYADTMKAMSKNKQLLMTYPGVTGAPVDLYLNTSLDENRMPSLPYANGGVNKPQPPSYQAYDTGKPPAANGGGPNAANGSTRPVYGSNYSYNLNQQGQPGPTVSDPSKVAPPQAQTGYASYSSYGAQPQPTNTWTSAYSAVPTQAPVSQPPPTGAAPPPQTTANPYASYYGTASTYYSYGAQPEQSNTASQPPTSAAPVYGSYYSSYQTAPHPAAPGGTPGATSGGYTIRKEPIQYG